MRLGGAPLGTPRRRFRSSFTDLTSALVYGCSGSLIISSALPTSTIWPAYITMILCAILAATPRSCVMRSRDMPISLLNSSSRSSIWACIVASSAEVGSSAIRSLGLRAMAMAIRTLCFMPPLSSWG